MPSSDDADFSGAASDAAAAGGGGELQCVGRLDLAAPAPALRFLRVGSIPVLTDSPFPGFECSGRREFPRDALLSKADSIDAPRYQMLPLETDLNTLPLLSDKTSSSSAKRPEGHQYGCGVVGQSLSRKCESLAVSGITEYGDEIDVIAPADILKQIFKIPYSKAQLSITVHRIGDAIILSSGPDVEEGDNMFRRQSNQSKSSDPSLFLNFAMHSVRAEACDCPPSHQQSTEEKRTASILPGHVRLRNGNYVTPGSSIGSSQFLDQNVDNGNGASCENHERLYWSKKAAKGSNPVGRTTQIGEKPRRHLQESENNRRASNNGFREVLFWQFHNFRMLLGSDLLIFSNEKYVAVSLHLWDIARQVTPLNWLDAWLDNMMASVPELAICYHRNGVVQGYELLENDDVFLLKALSEDGIPTFHPHVVQQNGLSVLRFLQKNCKQDPGAYWLYKGAEEDGVQLFNLSALPTKHSSDDHNKNCGSLSSSMIEGRRDSMFMLGRLLYRIGHKLSLSRVPSKRAKCAGFLRKCLDFLVEQDHLVVKAYAHEQFARLMLRCYGELEPTLEVFLLESNATFTDLDDETSELTLETFASRPNTNEDSVACKDGSLALEAPRLDGSQSDALCSNSEMLLGSFQSVGESAPSVLDVESCVNGICNSSEKLAMVQRGNTHIVPSVGDTISSRLAAIHHTSQAIKSLRCKRQLQSAEGDYVDCEDYSVERHVDISLCKCGDPDCVEVCDIREWLPKSQMDHKLWKLVLLLGESYLALGKAYKDDGQLHRASKVVESACLLYGSVPQQLADAEFISSMSSSLSHYRNDIEHTKDSKSFKLDHSTMEFSPNYLFWSTAWMLLGDVYSEFHKLHGNKVPVSAEESSFTELKLSNEVVKEVKRLNQKLGSDKMNCITCSLINCSCRSDRVNSGNSASSSSAETSATFVRNKNRKVIARSSNLSSQLVKDKAANKFCKSVINSRKDKPHFESVKHHSEQMNQHVECPQEHNNSSMSVQSREDESISSSPNKGASYLTSGGIFKFVKGPKIGDSEYNLSCAVQCYEEAKKAHATCPSDSELSSIVKKKGWACNELGRCKLEKNDLDGAENAFSDAVSAFQEVGDHTNIILINCNLGHGRRALAEELASKLGELQKYEIFRDAYLKTIQSAKAEYLKSVDYYSAAKKQLSYLNDGMDKQLYNEVNTQYANTYLRLGMLLSRESVTGETSQCRNIDDSQIERNNGLSVSEAFREALSSYESLVELRAQEAAYGYFQFGCYHRDMCLKFIAMVSKGVKHEDKHRHKAKWYQSLAEKNWNRALSFYSPKTHPDMHLKILLEQSTLEMDLSQLLHSSTFLEAALVHLLDGRHVEANEGCSDDLDLDIKQKFWNQLQVTLKAMLAASLAVTNASRPGSSSGRFAPCNKGVDSVKLKEIYRMSLKSTCLGQLHAMHNLWIM